ncbi:alpha/beta hydrolase-fold protein [Niabella terrae]
MKPILVFLCIAICSLTARSQDSLFIGIRANYDSRELREQRPYRVALPIHYYDTKYQPARYPVLYVLDGEMAFDYYVAVVRFLSKGVYASIPEMIVVGIDNTSRTRDFTPTNDTVPSPDNPAKGLFTDSGGADHFLDFLGGEFIPFIDSQYRSSGYRILAGHSFGGLVSAYSLLTRPDLFNAYLIHDPSIWWDGGLLLDLARKSLTTHVYKKTRVYLSQANNEEKGAFDAHFEHIKSFHQLIDSVANPGLAYQYTFYDGEDHGTLPLPAAYNGLRFLFDGYWMDFKKIKQDRQLLQKSYQSFSEKMNFKFEPSEPMLTFIIRYFKQINQPEAAAEVERLCRQLYAPKR